MTDLPTSEGHWWVNFDGFWTVVYVCDPTGDGLEVYLRGPVEQFKCDGWGPMIPPYAGHQADPTPPMSLHRFYFDAAAVARMTGWRYGQALFNRLLDVRPDLLEAAWGRTAATVRLPGEVRAVTVSTEIPTGEAT